MPYGHRLPAPDEFRAAFPKVPPSSDGEVRRAAIFGAKKSDPVEVLRKMPPGSDTHSLCDGGYLYFSWQEPKLSLLTPFNVTYTPALYRVPLDP